MSRTLALGLVLLGFMDASVRPPDTRIGEAIPRNAGEARLRQRELDRRRAIETAILARQLREVVVQERPAAQVGLAVHGAIVRQVWTDEQVEGWVFRPYANVSGARQQLVSQLAMQIVEIDGACDLSYAQKRKLRLAGRGDIKRFFDRYERVKQKLQSMKNDDQILQDIVAQYINPLHVAFEAGLFHENSLLVKSLRNTLTGEQLARYEAMARKHRATQRMEPMLKQAGLMPDDDDEAGTTDDGPATLTR